MKIEVDCLVTQYSGSVYGTYFYYCLKVNRDDDSPKFLWKNDREKHAGVHFAERHIYMQDKNICYVDGVEVDRETYSTWSWDQSLYLFGRHNYNGDFYQGSCSRIYSCKIWNNDELVREFVPCYNKNLNELGEEFGCGLYDTVTEAFYGNSGTGKFYSNYKDPSDDMFFDQEQYYIDHNLANNVAATTITGTGTQSDPYILNSSEDFWWAKKYLNWNNTYVELTCDVVLNEEKFDENGNVIEGTSVDGKVYSWDSGITGNGYISFDGKENTVFGLYYNDPETRSGALFSGRIKKLQNLSMAHVFVNTRREAAAFTTTTNADGDYENCHLFSGYVIGKTVMSGLFHYAGSVTSCSNYATINGANAVSGIAYIVRKGIYNTTNYGKVNSGGYYAAGISANYDYVMKFSFCENYGEITAEAYAGGICAACYGPESVKEIFHCKNYGKIHVDPNDYAAGIIAYSNGQAIINGCENYGEIFSANHQNLGAIIARIYVMTGTTTKINATITNCYAKVKGKVPFVGQIVYESAAIFENNVYENENNEGFTALFCRSMSSQRFVKIKNLKVKVNATVNTNNLLFPNHYMTQISMENVLVETNKQVTTLWPSSTRFEKLDGIIVNTPNQKFYYGSNFSDFNISWKTGAISLNSMSSMGSFAPRLTEENLLGMGFHKKSL